MITDLLPSDPASRRAILILQQHDIERCAYEPGAAKALLDEEVCVLQFPVRAQGAVSAALQNILDAGLARAGSMLVQSPYDPDTYEDAVLAPEKYALTKRMYFSKFCQYLGAKKVSIEQIDLRIGENRWTANVEGKRLGIGAQSTVENELLEKFRMQMNLQDEFEGGSPDIAAAEMFLRQRGLWADPGMRTLLEMRCDTANPLVERRLVLSLSSETQNKLNVVGRLKILAFVKFSAEYDRVVREQCEYTLTALVQF